MTCKPGHYITKALNLFQVGLYSGVVWESPHCKTITLLLYDHIKVLSQLFWLRQPHRLATNKYPFCTIKCSQVSSHLVFFFHGSWARDIVFAGYNSHFVMSNILFSFPNIFWFVKNTKQPSTHQTLLWSFHLDCAHKCVWSQKLSSGRAVFFFSFFVEAPCWNKPLAKVCPVKTMTCAQFGNRTKTKHCISWKKDCDALVSLIEAIGPVIK